MATDNFQGFEIGGTRIDLDNLHSSVDAGTVTLVSEVSNLAAGTITSVRSSMSFEHRKVDDGFMFHASDYIALASGGTRLITLGTSATEIHTYISISAKGAVLVRILEGGTTTPAGTLANYNRKRSGTATTAIEWISGTTLAGGTLLSTRYLPGGTGPRSTGGHIGDETGWYFDNDIQTCFEIVDQSAVANPVSILIDFYEETA